VAANKIDDEQLLAGLLSVFQTHGYGAASLSLIAEATGLQRASLYHRFPGGKEQMAEAVLEQADRQFDECVLAPLRSDARPGLRVRRMAEQLAAHYDGGRCSCLLETLSMAGGPPSVRAHVKRTFGLWLKAMAAVAREAGASPAVARKRAEDAIMQVQGGLVFARAARDRKPFERVLSGLPALLTGAR